MKIQTEYTHIFSQNLPGSKLSSILYDGFRNGMEKLLLKLVILNNLK